MFRATLVIGLVVLGALPAYAVKYSVTLLPSPGFSNPVGLGIDYHLQVGYGTTSGSANHALLWFPTFTVDLNPAGYTSSVAYAVSGLREAGAATIADGVTSHAILWNDDASNFVDLNPAGYALSTATGINGTTEVGYGTTNTSLTHALRWTGTAASAVDLNPVGFTASLASGASSTNQIGQATTAGGQTHAILWSGTAASAVDLEPAGFGNTFGVAADGASQAGYGSPAGSSSIHALLWHGTAASVVDLHPSGWTNSYVNSISGNTEVGSASTFTTSLTTHAFLWNNTAASALDLQQFVTSQLGPSFIDSEANGVDGSGNIVGRVQDTSFKSYAVVWKPETGIPGDYNNNGIVDMADYVFWRNGNATLLNEIATPGSNTPEDYTAWRAHFNDDGIGFGSAVATAEVPEPGTFLLIILASLATALYRRRA